MEKQHRVSPETRLLGRSRGHKHRGLGLRCRDAGSASVCAALSIRYLYERLLTQWLWVAMLTARRSMADGESMSSAEFWRSSFDALRGRHWHCRLARLRIGLACLAGLPLTWPGMATRELGLCVTRGHDRLFSPPSFSRHRPKVLAFLPLENFLSNTQWD